MEQPPRSPSPDSVQSGSTSSTEEETDTEENQRRRSFPSPYDFHNNDPITLVEVRMRFFSGKIRTKPAWWKKVHETKIVAKWRGEIAEGDKRKVENDWGGDKYWYVKYGKSAGKMKGRTKRWPREPITEAQLDYIIEELKYEATRRDDETGIFVSSISFTLYTCWCADKIGSNPRFPVSMSRPLSSPQIYRRSSSKRL